MTTLRHIHSAASRWRLLACLAALMALALPGLRAEGGRPACGHEADGCLRPTEAACPQWADVGLEDVLACVGQPSVEAPVAERRAPGQQHLAARQSVRVPMPVRRAGSGPMVPLHPCPGYLYLLLCLRL